MAEHGNTDANLRKRMKETDKVGVVSDEESIKKDKFIVSYRNRLYDIREFVCYHPGGRKVLGYFENRSLDRALEENPHSESAFHLFEEYAVDSEEKRQEIENLIDWNAPILGQVGLLGDRYWEWVNLPVNRDIRLFKSDFLERLTITPWYVIPIVWAPLCVYSLYLGYASNATNHYGNVLLKASISYLFGLLLWSIIEYLLHRKVFHLKPPETSRTLILLHFLSHGVHHKAPFDSRRLVFPPTVGLIIARILWCFFEAIFPKAMFHFIAAGTVTGYICYDLIHYYLHHGAPKDGTYLYTMKRYHNYHHFLHHDLGYGVSSELWDHAFGTEIFLRQLSKPIEW